MRLNKYFGQRKCVCCWEQNTKKTQKKRYLKMIFPSRSSSPIYLLCLSSKYVRISFEKLLQNTVKFLWKRNEKTFLKFASNIRSHSTDVPMCRCVLGRVFVHKQTAQQKEEKKNRIMPKQMARLRTTDTSRRNPPPPPVYIFFHFM